jgi:hypothetical protein
MFRCVPIALSVLFGAVSCASQGAAVPAPVIVDLPPATVSSGPSTASRGASSLPPTLPSTPPGAPAALDEDDASTGVPECDAYIQRWKECYANSPAEAAARPGLEQMIAAWRAVAKEPSSRRALAQGCKMAFDNFPKAACH